MILQGHKRSSSAPWQSARKLVPITPTRPRVLSNLAGLLQARGDFAGARPLFERALAIREKAGADHPDTAASLSNLAGLLQARGDFAGARPLFERALAIREKAGADHPDTAASLSNLAGLLQAQGDFETARPLFERALAIGEKFGPIHPAVAKGLTNLAGLLRTQGNLAKAQSLYQRALGICESLLEGNDPGQSLQACKKTFRDNTSILELVRLTAHLLGALGRETDATVVRSRFARRVSSSVGQRKGNHTTGKRG